MVRQDNHTCNCSNNSSFLDKIAHSCDEFMNLLNNNPSMPWMTYAFPKGHELYPYGFKIVRGPGMSFFLKHVSVSLADGDPCIATCGVCEMNKAVSKN